MRSLSLLLLPALAACKDAHAAIQSSRGVQHKAPLISDDFVVGCIMIMFLMLFAFGMQDHKLHFFHQLLIHHLYKPYYNVHHLLHHQQKLPY